MTAWHVINCRSGAEAKAVTRLADLGYPGAWYPLRKVRRRHAVYARLMAAWKRTPMRSPSKKPTRTIEKPWISGYVFLPADGIEGHVIVDKGQSELLRPLIIGGAYVALTDADLANMASIPERLAKAKAEAERAAEAAWRAKMPIVGGKRYGDARWPVLRRLRDCDAQNGRRVENRPRFD